MGCGRVDLIDLFDLARDNLPPVRRRELEAHLHACPPCSADFEKIRRIHAAFLQLRSETSVSLSPKQFARLHTRLMEVVSSFEPAKARRLWQPQSPAAPKPQLRPRRWGRRAALAASSLLLLLVLSAAGWSAWCAFEGSGYPEEPLWRIALLLPPQYGRRLLHSLPVRRPEDVLSELLAGAERKTPPPVVKELAETLGPPGQARFVEALSGPFGDEWFSVLAAARMLLPYAVESGDWERAAGILSGIRRRDPSVTDSIAGLEEPLRSDLSELVRPWLPPERTGAGSADGRGGAAATSGTPSMPAGPPPVQEDPATTSGKETP